MKIDVTNFDFNSENSNDTSLPSWPKMADNETRTVRFMISSPEDIDIEDVHHVEDGSQWGHDYDCVGKDCPFCAANMPLERKVYFPVTTYINGTAENGVWISNMTQAKIINSALNDYADLNTILCNVTKMVSSNGGRKTTRYQISPNVKPKEQANYPAKDYDRTVFPSRRFIRKRSAEDMAEFIRTGAFPERSTNTETTPVMSDNSDLDQMFTTPLPTNTNTAPMSLDDLFPGM